MDDRVSYPEIGQLLTGAVPLRRRKFLYVIDGGNVTSVSLTDGGVTTAALLSRSDGWQMTLDAVDSILYVSEYLSPHQQPQKTDMLLTY